MTLTMEKILIKSLSRQQMIANRFGNLHKKMFIIIKSLYLSPTRLSMSSARVIIVSEL